MSRGRGSGGGGYGRGRGKASGPPFGMTWPEYMALKTEAVNRPSKLFPPMDIPLPMPFTKQEIRGHELGSGYRNKLRSTPYYITSPKPDRAIERFSDQYSDKKHVGSLTSIQTMIECFPAELHDVLLGKETKKGVTKRRQTIRSSERVFSIAEKEPDNKDQESDKEQQSEEEPMEDEDDYEEEHDYGDNYFDNGEGEDDIDVGGGDEDTY